MFIKIQTGGVRCDISSHMKPDTASRAFNHVRSWSTCLSWEGTDCRNLQQLSSQPCHSPRGFPSLSSRFLYSHLRVRNSNFSMECLDTRNNNTSHPAANNSGRCTQTVVCAEVTRAVCSLVNTLLFIFIYNSFLFGIPLPRHARMRE